MNILTTKIRSDTWITASWDEYIAIIKNPEYRKAKSYYYRGQFRIEMPPLGNDHASDHSIITLAIQLFAITKNIPFNGKDNCTYRQTGKREVQPDLSFYIGENVDEIPWGTTIIDLEQYLPPNLVIEVANKSLADDQGQKRLLYEDLGVQEYWIVDVQKVKIIAFKMEKGGSYRIGESEVLSGLSIALLEEALGKTRQMNHSQVGAWLLTQFQS